MSWEKTNILTAAMYLRGLIANGKTDAQAEVVYEGLLDVLDPTRRQVRKQRELAKSLGASSEPKAPGTKAERRIRLDRRGPAQRRRLKGVPSKNFERRSGRERRVRARRGRRLTAHRPLDHEA